MARLTLSFKGQRLKIFALGEPETIIGRHSDCAICIDSLAIEPQHAIIRQSGEACSIAPLSVETPVFVNDVQIEAAHEFAAGDLVQIGKHTLSYSVESMLTIPETQEPSQTTTCPDAHGWLQILSGPHLGRTIRLDKAFTRIGSDDSNLAVIAHRNDGYYLSHLNGKNTPLVNDHDIGELTHKLCNEDPVSVGELQVQFFSDTEQTSQESSAMNEAGRHSDQRKFSRIPFDVSITLHLGDERWEGKLADISLHGALVHTHEDFKPVAGAQYRLDIHLEGGPDIVMDVHVAHQEAGNTGLRCDDIGVDSITHLRRLVELNLGDPELVERELSALTPAEPA